MQWHSIFAHLLRPLLQDYYEVLTDVPVGDLPRQADIVLVHRTAAGPIPVQGIWRHLTAWNILEFKGPSDDPALRDLDLLWEVGLGIERRLNEERMRQGQPAWPRDQVSWWYLANHVGQRLRTEAEYLLGQPLEERGAGLWQGAALGRQLWLVSRDSLPLEADNVPLEIVTQGSVEREHALLQYLGQHPSLFEAYGAWLVMLHPTLKAEVDLMVGQMGKEAVLDFRPLIEMVGLQRVIDQVGLQRVIDQVGLQRVIDQVGLQRAIDQVGVKQVIDQVGVKQVVEEVGTERLVAELGVDGILSSLTPEQLQEVKKRLS